MTTVLALILAATTAGAPPRPGHKLGMIPPREADYEAAGRKGVDFLTYRRRAKAILPPAVDLSERMPPIFPPGQQDQDCVGWAMAYAAKSYYEGREFNRRPGRTDSIFSPMFIYSQRSNRDESGDDKDGMNPLEALRILEHQGCATWDMMPYDKSRVNDPPTDEVLNRSYPFQIANHMIVPPTVDGLKVMLANDKVVVLGIAVTPAFEKLSGGEVLKEHDPEEIEGFHAICAVGYDDNRRAIRLMNSWGDSWADNGFCWISYDLFSSDLPKEKRFCGRAFALVEAPTVDFRVQSSGGRWTLAMSGSPEAMSQLYSVDYYLPDTHRPEVITKHDADRAFALDSSEVKPAEGGGAAMTGLMAVLNTRAGNQIPRLVVVSAGQAGAHRPPGPGRNAVEVPDLFGMEPQRAVLLMLRAGLQPKISSFSSEGAYRALKAGLPKLRSPHRAQPPLEVTRGRVARQSPEPRTRAPRGSTVVLFVAH